MTIAERINLHRCGYSRAEIDALAKEEKEAQAATDPAASQDPAPATDPAASQDPAPATDPAASQDPAPAMDPAASQDPAPDPVLEAIKGLTAAIQASNINKTPQPEKQQETVSDLLKNL